MLYSVPPTLSPYVTPAPQGSLTLVTSVLDAVSNWLLLRYVHAALKGNAVDKTHGGGDVLASDIGNDLQENFNVIFVSVLRDFDQWREMGKKVVRGVFLRFKTGLDLILAAEADTSIYCVLFSPSVILILATTLEDSFLQPRQGLDFAALITTKRLFYINGLVEPTTSPNSQQRNANMITLDLSNTQDLENLVRRYAEHGKDGGQESKTLVIMDGLDFLLASRSSFTNLALSRTIMTLRQYVHNIIVTSSADYPLLHNSPSSATPLEGEHRAFVTTMAHQSRIVVQLRSLGTGAAKDITGVLRISAGGAYDESKEDDAAFEEAEWLYQVRGDGSVRIWGRGE